MPKVINAATIASLITSMNVPIAGDPRNAEPLENVFQKLINNDKLLLNGNANSIQGSGVSLFQEAVPTITTPVGDPATMNILENRQRYCKIGPLVYLVGRLSFDDPGTAAGSAQISIPLEAKYPYVPWISPGIVSSRYWAGEPITIYLSKNEFTFKRPGQDGEGVDIEQNVQPSGSVSSRRDITYSVTYEYETDLE